MSNIIFLYEISSEILVAALPVLIFLWVKWTIKSLKITSNEAKRLSLYFPVSFFPVFLFLIIILDLGGLLNLEYVLVMADATTPFIWGGAAFYLQHLVNPRLKRDYGFTYEYFKRNGHGIWKSLDQFEEYKKDR